MKFSASKLLPLAVMATIGIAVFAFMQSDDTQQQTETTQTVPVAKPADRDTPDEKAAGVVGGMIRDVNLQMATIQKQLEKQMEANAQLRGKIKELGGKVETSTNTVATNAVDKLTKQVSQYKRDLNALVTRSTQFRTGGAKQPASRGAKTDPYKVTWTYPPGFGPAQEFGINSGKLGGLTGLPSRTQQYPAKKQSTLSSGAPGDKSNIVKKYTIHDAMMMEAVTESSLIGVVPIEGVVNGSFSFAGLIDKGNLAAMGFKMPELKGIRFRGTAIGNYSLSCVRGNIESMTFVFKDGTISTTPATDGKPLAELQSEFGRSCIPGTKVGNLKAFLVDKGIIGGLEAAGEGFSAAKSTRTFSPDTGVVSQIVNSDVLGYMGGNALAGGARSAGDLLDDLVDASVAVYIDNGMSVRLLMLQSVNIDYDPDGRKLRYNRRSDYATTTLLD